MPNRILASCLLFWLAASAAWAGSVERARELYLSGDLDGAAGEVGEILAGDDDAQRPSALELLGQIEMDRRNWRAALDAWGELTDRHALSPEAASVSLAIRPLQALVACGCDAPAEPASVVAHTAPTAREAAAAEGTPPAAPAAPPATAATAPAPAPLPEPAAPAAEPATAPADGLILVGGWGAEYEAAVEVAAALTEFLDSNGVAVRAASTEIPAIHGEDAVLAFLLEEARESNADGVLFLTSRFDFREYLQVRRFDVGGSELWSERVVGGTALKERRDRGKPSWNLLERIKKKLSRRLGTADLPTG